MYLGKHTWDMSNQATTHLQVVVMTQTLKTPTQMLKTPTQMLKNREDSNSDREDSNSEDAVAICSDDSDLGSGSFSDLSDIED